VSVLPALLLFVLPASASRGGALTTDLCATDAACAPSYVAGKFDLHMRDKEGQEVLNKILADEAFWSGAWKQAYEGKLYDEIRLKDTASGYVPMITGEGDQDFGLDVVSDVVFMRNTDLPKYMDGAKSVTLLGTGYDPVVGADYRDCFYILDLTLFYGTFPQRMYRKHDPTTNAYVMWFEKMDSTFVDAGTWAAYEAKMKAQIDGMDKRWMLSSVIEVTEIYGMFVVEPGKSRKSRVSFVSKLTFGSETGWVAQMGSQMPGVIRSGLKSGFAASVAITKHETERRNKVP
jgi:hypothetical protein